MNSISLSNSGAITPDQTGNALGLIFLTHSYLSDASVEISFSTKLTNPQANDITMRLRLFDSTTNDEIYKVEGMLSNDPKDMSSILARAEALEVFEQFDLAFSPSVVDAIKNSNAFNASNSLGRSKAIFVLPDETPPSFSPDDTYKLITNMVNKPAYLTLPTAKYLPVFASLLRVAEKLNIPLDVELDPTLTAEQAAATALSLDAQSMHVQYIWSPNLCRPRDAISLKGRKVSAPYLGQYIGNKLLRNARTDANGLAPIHIAVAWEDYAFKAKVLTLRPDINFDDETVEMLAKAKVNVVRPIEFDRVKFVLSDILTQYQSKNSALKQVTCAEIAMRTSNQCVRILKRHMLKPMPDYIEKASKEIGKYLDNAVTAGWLQPAEDLGGKPYAFSLVPDADYPFERVRLKLERRPTGSTRTVIFDEDVVVK